MSVEEIFNGLIATHNTDTLLTFIQDIKESIPPSQRTSKGIVWSLRQIRRQLIEEGVHLTKQKHSLEILINSNHWQVRHLTSLIATHCSIEERNFDSYIPVIEAAANDSHFGVRESAQMAMRELMQAFPDEVLQLYDNKWISHPEANVRRCVSESLRPVLVEGKNWLREEPEEVIKRLKRLNQDTSLYVRKSVGNNLADISRRYPDLVLSTLRKWLLENDYDKKTFFIARKACRRVIKSHPDEVTELLRGESVIK
ncbi:MAG: hypothetical protein JSV04_05910 [Candidatus Heimdallarchaeota archaeon]|nr:MAG: hypothetical protein JSV04_05910 [Candidatus Heimdallarchaeota archaeon]